MDYNATETTIDTALQKTMMIARWC